MSFQGQDGKKMGVLGVKIRKGGDFDFSHILQLGGTSSTFRGYGYNDDAQTLC